MLTPSYIQGIAKRKEVNPNLKPTISLYLKNDENKEENFQPLSHLVMFGRYITWWFRSLGVIYNSRLNDEFQAGYQTSTSHQAEHTISNFLWRSYRIKNL